MAAGLPDRVDCAHLADDAVVLERVYPLGELPRLQDVLADARGSVRARFEFAKVDSGRAGATVAVEACPQLVCQRCLQGFAYEVAGSSEIEPETYATDEGLVSLREVGTSDAISMEPSR